MPEFILLANTIATCLLLSQPVSAETQSYAELTKTIEAAHSSRLQYFMTDSTAKTRTQWSTNDATHTYHPTVPDLVKSVKIVGESNFEPPFESTFKLLEHDPSPAPLAVFDVGLPSAPQAWTRRLVLLAAGVAMIAARLLWQKKQTAPP